MFMSAIAVLENTTVTLFAMVYPMIWLVSVNSIDVSEDSLPVSLTKVG